jgi:membrane-associated phospholipid phosphatase
LRKRISPILCFGFAALALADTALAKTTFIVPFNMAFLATFHSLNIHLPWLTGPMLAATFLGSDPFLFAFVTALSIGIAIRKWQGEAWGMIGMTVFARIVDMVAKKLVQSPRPFLIFPTPCIHAFSGYGFPSGHALMSIVVFGSVAVLALRHAKTKVVGIAVALICAVLILAIGVSRISLGAHWANDVLGGYLYGACILSLGACPRIRGHLVPSAAGADARRRDAS